MKGLTQLHRLGQYLLLNCSHCSLLFELDPLVAIKATSANIEFCTNRRRPSRCAVASRGFLSQDDRLREGLDDGSDSFQLVVLTEVPDPSRRWVRFRQIHSKSDTEKRSGKRKDHRYKKVISLTRGHFPFPCHVSQSVRVYIASMHGR